MKSIIIIACLVAVAFAANYHPQSVTPTILQDRVTVTGTVTGTATNPYYTNLYAIYVPSNASYINVTTVNTNYQTCGYLQINYRSNGGACNSGDYDADNFYCGNGYTDYFSSTNNDVFYAGYASGVSEFKSGDYFYISLSPYSSQSTCTYSIQVQLGYCPTGNTIPTTSGSTNTYSIDNVTCIAYTTVNNTMPSTVNVIGTGSNYYGAWVMDVAESTGQITVIMNFTESSISMYGNQWSAYGQTGNYKCYSYTSSSSGDYYIGTLNCYTPRKGQFVWTINTDYEFNGTITFIPQICPSGFGGYNCSFPISALNMSTIASGGSITFSIPYNSAYLSYYQNLYYVDIPTGYTGADFLLYASVASSTGSVYYMVRPDGYPEYYSPYGYEDSDEQFYVSSGSTSTDNFWGLSAFDYLFGARYYFAFLCYSSPYCNVTLSAGPTTTTTIGTTGTGSTTGSTTALTTASTTGSTTGITTATTTGSTTGSTTALTTATTTGSTTGITTKSNSTTMVTTKAVTTGTTSTSTSSTTGEKSGVEVIIPSIVLLFVAALF